jgi:ubiquinone/menaquinone biosynthesis C-methylase UbiE
MITPARDRITDPQHPRASLIEVAQEHFFGESSMPDVIAQWRGSLRALRLQPGARVLDVGCHDGDAIALLLADHPDVGSVIGLDRNERKTSRARERFAADARVEIVTGEATTLPFDNARFDRHVLRRHVGVGR